MPQWTGRDAQVGVEMGRGLKRKLCLKGEEEEEHSM